MADASIIDIGGVQWNVKDTKARDDIKEILNKRSEILDEVFSGTFNFDGKLKYLGEDSEHIYYIFWWIQQEKKSSAVKDSILVSPPKINTDKIININMNIVQYGNTNIIQKTQYATGTGGASIITYIQNASNAQSWTISAMGILRRKK